ncbi:MAG: hypothetical protein ACFFG0_26755 [Candidatus Thorarchaeota archaeon]
MVKIIILARRAEHIGISPIDFFSLGHLFMGYITFLGFYGTISLFFGISLNFFYLLGNIFIGIIWEAVENFILYKLKFKFAQRRDSIINSLMDIIFFLFGGIIAMLIVLLEIYLFFIGTLLFLLNTLILLDIYALKILKPVIAIQKEKKLTSL